MGSIVGIGSRLAGASRRDTCYDLTQSSSEEIEALTDELLPLYQTAYRKASRSLLRFSFHTADSDAQPDVARLRVFREGGQPIGYSMVSVYRDIPCAGDRLTVFRADVVVHPDHRGRFSFTWDLLRETLRFRLTHPWKRAIYYGCTTLLGYHFVVRHVHEVYPSPYRPTPPELMRQMRELGELFFGDEPGTFQTDHPLVMGNPLLNDSEKQQAWRREHGAHHPEITDAFLRLTKGRTDRFVSILIPGTWDNVLLTVLDDGCDRVRRFWRGRRRDETPPASPQADDPETEDEDTVPDRDGRRWLGSYDPGVNADIPSSEATLLEALRDAARRHPRQVAFDFMGARTTYAELFERAGRFARAIRGLGCRPGDVVGIQLPNTPQFLVALVGSLMAGCAVTTVSPLLTSPEILHQLRDSGARILVTLDFLLQRVLPVADRAPSLRVVVSTGAGDELPRIKRVLARVLKKLPSGPVPRGVTATLVLTLPDLMRGASAPMPFTTTTADDVALIPYTGGTTGAPKGVRLTHRNLVANLNQLIEWTQPPSEDAVILSCFPFFHLAGLMIGITALRLAATQLLIPDPRDTRTITRLLGRHRPQLLCSVPTLYGMLLRERSFRRADFSRLIAALSGAAPLPAELSRSLEEVIGQGKVIEVYGMTETSPLVTMNPRFGAKKVGSVGLPLPSTRVKLVDLETGTREVPPGERGQLIVRGPQVMGGYWNNPEETAHALRSFEGELWLYTGDVAVMDDEGYLSIVDRVKDMINVGGYKVFSREVEEAIHQHPAVARCAVIGAPDPDRPGSERVALFVEARPEHSSPGTDGLARELEEHCRRHLAPYKVPATIEVLSQIPLTAIGKVDKQRLRGVREATSS